MKKILVILLILTAAVTAVSCSLFGIDNVLISTSVGLAPEGRTTSYNKSAEVKNQIYMNYLYPELWFNDGIFDNDMNPIAYDEVLDSANKVAVHEIEEFKIVADVVLVSSETDSNQAWIMTWGGDESVSPFVDIMNGDLTNDLSAEEASLLPIIYETVWFQIKGDGESVKPKGLPSLTLNEVLPIGYITSTTNIFFSTFIDEPFVAHLLEEESFQTLQSPGTNKDDFDRVKNQDFDDFDPGVHTDPPSIFLPLANAIDLTGLTATSSLSIRIEGYFDDLLTEYNYDVSGDDDTFYFLSPLKSYTDDDGNTVYGPLPFSVTYTIE